MLQFVAEQAKPRLRIANGVLQPISGGIPKRAVSFQSINRGNKPTSDLRSLTVNAGLVVIFAAKIAATLFKDGNGYEYTTKSFPLGVTAGGALAMFLLDPITGKRRMSLIRDQTVSVGTRTGRMIQGQSEYLKNRTRAYTAKRNPCSDPDVHHRAPMTFRGDQGRDETARCEKQGKRLVDYSADGYEAIMVGIVGIVANNPLRDAGWHDIFSVPCRSENDFDVSSSRNTSGEMDWSIPRSRG